MSEYVKLDDNLLRYDFDQPFFKFMQKKQLNDIELLSHKEEFNRIHLIYLSEDKVRLKNEKSLELKEMFMKQL